MLTLEIIYARTSVTVLDNVSSYVFKHVHFSYAYVFKHVIPLHKRERKTDKKSYEKLVFFLICPKFMKNNVIKSFMNMIPSPR